MILSAIPFSSFFRFCPRVSALAVSGIILWCFHYAQCNPSYVVNPQWMCELFYIEQISDTSCAHAVPAERIPCTTDSQATGSVPRRQNLWECGQSPSTFFLCKVTRSDIHYSNGTLTSREALPLVMNLSSELPLLSGFALWPSEAALGRIPSLRWWLLPPSTSSPFNHYFLQRCLAISPLPSHTSFIRALPKYFIFHVLTVNGNLKYLLLVILGQ